MKKICETVLDSIGHTPMVRLNRITHGVVKATVLAKLETYNPGNSIKDRMAVKMIEDAERAGLLKPGGTIIEGTSGNTGMGLALVAAVRGYKCVFTTTDKQSKEKVDLLKALGAEVIVCPTAVEPEDPRSYYTVAKKLAREIPNSFYPNQYDNPCNPEAHYKTTGPEIWEDTEGKITHFICGMGTGGTISGVGKYLKEKNPKIKIVGVESSDGPGMKKSIEAGRVVTLDQIDCIIDGLRVKRVGEHTFSVVQRFVDDIVTLPDREIFDAMIWIMSHCKLVVEGAAAAPVAALLHGLVKAPAGSRVACVLSGGNVNLDQLKNLKWN